MGRWRRSRRRGPIARLPNPPPHLWGGGGAAAGGAPSPGCQNLLPIYGEVAAQPPEGPIARLPKPPPHLWAGGGAAAGGAPSPGFAGHFPASGEECCRLGASPEQPIAEITETRNDVGLVIEPLVQRRG